MFQVEHGDESTGFAAVDSIVFNYDPSMKDCKILPPQADVGSSSTTATQPADGFPDCKFEESECGWIIETNANMKWMRTRNEDLAEMGYDGPSEVWDGYFMYVSARDGYADDMSTLSTEMHPNAVKGCMSFQFSIFVSNNDFFIKLKIIVFQHSGGIKALKVYSEGADGYREPLWQINDMTMEANKEWWKGQVKINDHQVRKT